MLMSWPRRRGCLSPNTCSRFVLGVKYLKECDESIDDQVYYVVSEGLLFVYTEILSL